MMNRVEMKKAKEYKIGVGLSCVALILLCVALIVGVVRIDTSIERVCFFLGIALNCFAIVLFGKAKKKS